MHMYYGATIAVPHLEHAYIDPVLGPSNDDKKRIRLFSVGVERLTLRTSLSQPSSTNASAVSAYTSWATVTAMCAVRISSISSAHGTCSTASMPDECDLLVTPATAIKKRFVMDTSKPSGPLFDLYQVGMLLADSPITDSTVELWEHLLSKNFTTTTVKRALAKLLAYFFQVVSVRLAVVI